MSDLSIKLNIADRVYPLTIEMSEEEEIRKAAKMINEKLKEYESNYAVKDKQDLLAMCALELGTGNGKALDQFEEADHLLDKVKSLNRLIEETL